jgi:hypothetical protein
VDKIEVERQGDVRRAKLTYLRHRIGKGATLVKERESESKIAKAAATAKTAKAAKAEKAAKAAEAAAAP